MITLESLKSSVSGWLGLELLDHTSDPKNFILRFKMTAPVAGATQLAKAAKEAALAGIQGIFLAQQFVYDPDTKKVPLIGYLKIKRSSDESVLSLLRKVTLQDYPAGTQLKVSIGTGGRTNRVKSERATRPGE